MSSSQKTKETETSQGTLTDTLGCESTSTIQSYHKNIETPHQSENRSGQEGGNNEETIILPYTHEELEPISTWEFNTTPNENLSSLFERIKTQKTLKEPDTKATDSEVTRTPPKPISTYAPNAVKDNHDTPTSNYSQRNKSKPSVHKDQLLDKLCDECGSQLTADGTDYYCDSCGVLVSDQQIDPGPEWRAFDSRQKEDRTRVGGPIRENIHDKGLSTVIGHDKTDAHGKPISREMNQKMSRLRKWDRRFKVKNTKERNLRQAFGEIQRMSSEMNLPEYIEETACTIYRKALDEELLPGRSIEAMASASVYIAMRQGGIPKTLDSLLTYCRVEESRVTGAYSYLGKELGIEIQPPEILGYISKVASELEVTSETERMAEELLQNSIDKNIHSGKAPSGMAAAAVYAATMITRRDRITQQQACDAGDVCELTIRTRNRELLEAYGVDYEETNPPSKKEVKQTRNA